jgi:phosphoglycolate phosphatase
MKYKAVLFDLDGTLLDTIEDLSNSMNAVLLESGFPMHDLEEYKCFVGNGLRNLVRRALPAENRDDITIDSFLAAMNEEYSKRWAEKTRPYKGIPELLDELTRRNIRLSVLSNKPHKFTKVIVEKFLSNWNFEVVFGERLGVAIKPDPSAAIEISAIMGIPPEDFLYLGDSGTDMKTARAAGMYAVGALWGFRKKEELVAEGAMSVISSPLELIDIL